MASIILKDIKTHRKRKTEIIREVLFTDVDVKEHFGSESYIKEKLRLAQMRRVEQIAPEHFHL